MSQKDQWGFGNPAEAKPLGHAVVNGQIVALLWGEHPHSRSENSVYARFPNGEVHGFSGHRVVVRVEVEESNYLKESELSGDEVRKSAVARIYMNGVQVYEVGHRDAQPLLLRCHALIDELSEFAVHLWDPEDVARWTGRRVFYRDHPAVVDRFVLDQGEVVLRPEGAPAFPRPAWDQPDELGFELDEEDLATAKVDVLSKDIWWFRE